MTTIKIQQYGKTIFTMQEDRVPSVDCPDDDSPEAFDDQQRLLSRIENAVATRADMEIGYYDVLFISGGKVVDSCILVK